MDGWDGIDEEFRSPDDDLNGLESFGDGISTIPDPEDTTDPVDAVMRLCVRIDPRNPLHEKIYLWASRLPTDRRGLSNIGAHIIQALNRYLDDAARPISDAVYSSSVGPARFAAISQPSQSLRGAASDRARYREILRHRQESAAGIPDSAPMSTASSERAPVVDVSAAVVGSPSNTGDSSLSATPEAASPAHEKTPVEPTPPPADYGFLSAGVYGDEKTGW
jgi:hypothetical protein